MPRNTGPDFNHAANNGDSQPEQHDGDLTIVIRTDARHATASIKQNLLNHLQNRPAPPTFNHAAQEQESPASIEASVEKAVHGTYEKWGQTVLSALKDCVDVSHYKLKAGAISINTHFYNTQELAVKTIASGANLVRNEALNVDFKSGVQEEKTITAGNASSQGNNIEINLAVVYVSLDELIKGTGAEFEEIAFSRLFSLDGREQFGYVARPGYKSIEEQIQAVRDKVEALSENHGRKIPVVLLEDNVRHARMLNWVIDMMEQGGVFEHGKLAGISTSFCCATQEERAAIEFREATVPLAIAVDYADKKADVVTTRDLLFDGYVVEIEGEKKRLPAIFMDIGKLFKINHELEDEFKLRVIEANMEFCRTIEDDFSISLPLKWFSTAEAISHVTGFTPDTPMTYILQSLQSSPVQDNRPDNEKGCGPCQNLAP